MAAASLPMALETMDWHSSSPSLRGLENGPAGGQLRLLAEQLRERGRAAAMHRRPGFAFDGARRKHRLQAAAIAAGAEGAVRIDGQVAQVAGHAGVAAQHLAVGQHRAAHSHSQGQHQHVLQAARRAPHHLARQRHARVVVGEYRHVGGQSHQVAQAQAFQKMQRARAESPPACCRD